MISLSSALLLAHLVGIALAVGAATVKLTLLLMSISDPTLLPAFVKIARPVTRLIIIGMILLALSGIGWLIDGYPFTFLPHCEDRAGGGDLRPGPRHRATPA